MPVVLEELAVADPPEAWAEAGFEVGPDDSVLVDGLRVRLLGRTAGRGIVGWSLSGLPTATDDLDGLPTTAVPPGTATAPAHPNGVVALDHVVVLTPDVGRTVGTLAASGIEARRTREVPPSQYGFAAVQTFFRVGRPILELLGPAEPSGDGPSGFFGLAWTVSDLDALAERLGEGLGRAKDAVQPGRRIATLRHKAFGMSVATALLTPDPGDH